MVYQVQTVFGGAKRAKTDDDDDNDGGAIESLLFVPEPAVDDNDLFKDF